MAFFYIRHNSSFLKQGEILSNLFEFKLQIPQANSVDDIRETARFDPIVHPYVIVVSQDCDLEGDHRARSGETSEDKLLTHVLFCALFLRDEAIDRSKLKSDLFKRVRQNQDERYHHLDEAPVNGTRDNMPEFIADFKTTFSLPIELVYWLVETGQATRKGGLPSPYLEDFIHRLYSFLGRVATP